MEDLRELLLSGHEKEVRKLLTQGFSVIEVVKYLQEKEDANRRIREN